MRIFGALAVALAVSVMAGCGGSVSSSSSVTGPTTSATTVSIVRGAENLTTTAYSPNPVVVPAGTTITWTNNDTTEHTSTADASGWSSGIISPGGSFSVTLQTAGTFTYHCTIHPNMVGTVTVQ